jgi:hypothetical protein
MREKMFVTLGWDALPTTTKGDGYVLPRAAELILRKDYYPNWPDEFWPVDPETGEKLEIEPHKQK